MKTQRLVLAALLWMLVLTPAAFTALARYGSINPYNAATHTGNGFRRCYVDQSGAAADLSVPPFVDGLGAIAPTMIFASRRIRRLTSFLQTLVSMWKPSTLMLSPTRTPFSSP